MTNMAWRGKSTLEGLDIRHITRVSPRLEYSMGTDHNIIATSI